MSNPSLAAVLLFLVVTPLHAEPLFESNDPFAITLTAPFDRIKGERDKSAIYPGELRLDSTMFKVDLTLRGNRRLNKSVCDYPPLRIDFDKTETGATVFAKQSDLKLVVRCRDASVYADYLRTEYLVYKAFNLLTPFSYQVRWIDAKFVDSSGSMKDRLEGAFFVERKARLATRNDRKVADMPGIQINELDADAAALVSLFQYLIANADYSLTTAPPGDECCHNAKLLAGPTPGTYTPVIYDFDSAGAINAVYALPAKFLRIKKVTDRVYRGYCTINPALQPARAKVLAAQTAIIALFESDSLLSNSKKKRVVRFLNDGFDRLRDDKDFDRKIVNQCL